MGVPNCSVQLWQLWQLTHNVFKIPSISRNHMTCNLGQKVCNMGNFSTILDTVTEVYVKKPNYLHRH